MGECTRWLHEQEHWVNAHCNRKRLNGVEQWLNSIRNINIDAISITTSEQQHHHHHNRNGKFYRQSSLLLSQKMLMLEKSLWGIFFNKTHIHTHQTKTRRWIPLRQVRSISSAQNVCQLCSTHNQNGDFMKVKCTRRVSLGAYYSTPKNSLLQMCRAFATLLCRYYYCYCHACAAFIRTLMRSDTETMF